MQYVFSEKKYVVLNNIILWIEVWNSKFYKYE